MSTPEITPSELVGSVEANEEIHVLDVRAPHRLESGRIDIVPDAWFHNIVGSQVLQRTDLGLPRGRPVAVVCGFGNDSRSIADHLNRQGYNAASVAGGMVAWMGVVVQRELEPPAGLDRLVQFDRVGKGALGYLLVSDDEALLVDVSRHTAAFCEALDGARLVGVADTHAHADFISGGPALAAGLGVPYFLHPRDAVYPYDGTLGKIAYEAVEEGQTIPLGSTEVAVVHTPGHTEGSVCYRIGDDAVLTGDFVFVHSVGRPDLGGKTEEWTGVLFESLERARREWPDAVRVHPAHYSAASERNPDRSVGRTFGELRTSNEQVAETDRERFAAWVAARAGSFPEAYRRIKAINVGLEAADEETMNELEAGKNQCALA